MNILYFSSKHGWAGIVSWMVKTAAGLEKRGHNVFIVTAPDSELARVSPPGIRLMPMYIGCDYNPFTIARLVSLIRQNHVDLVVSNIQKEVGIAGMAARICGIPNIRRIGLHVDLNSRLKVKANQALFVDHNIIPCQAIFDKAKARLPQLRESDFTVIYNGRNPVQYPPGEIANLRSSWGVRDGEVIYGVTSQLSKVKSVDIIIRAFSELHRLYPDTKLVIAGNGPEKQRLLDLAGRLCPQGAVVFTGFTSNPAFQASGYDVALSASTLEGFPNSVVEYMAAGCAVISTNVDGVPEVIRDGGNGLLFDPADRNKLLDRMRLLREDHLLRRDLGKAARDTILLGFNEERMIGEILACFEKNLRK